MENIVTEINIRRDVFRHVEAELYAYPFRKKEIARLREEILYPHQPEDEQNVKSMGNKIGDPTAKKAIKLVSHSKLLHQERMIDAIEESYNKLPPEMQKLIQLKYWTKPQRYSTLGLCDQVGISESTYRRWRRAFIQNIADILGW